MRADGCRMGQQPESGGWYRFQLEVDDLEATEAALKRDGAHPQRRLNRQWGKQILVNDPAGDPVPFFDPRTLKLLAAAVQLP